MRKLYLLMAVLVIGALILGACATATPTEAPAPATTAHRSARRPRADGRAGGAVPGGGGDAERHQRPGLQPEHVRRSAEDPGRDGRRRAFEIAYSENMFVIEDAAAAIRDYASQGFDLVIAHGSQYGSSLQEIAPDFPETSFAWGTTVDTFGMPNVFAYEARSEEGGYVNGVVAASLSESGVIGVIGPIETGDAKLYVDGFTAGVTGDQPGRDSAPRCGRARSATRPWPRRRPRRTSMPAPMS